MQVVLGFWEIDDDGEGREKTKEEWGNKKKKGMKIGWLESMPTDQVDFRQIETRPTDDHKWKDNDWRSKRDLWDTQMKVQWFII